MNRIACLAAATALVAAIIVLRPASAEVTPQSADVNGDGVVNVIDLAIVASHTDPRGDVDGNGVIDANDLAAVAQWFGWLATPTPAPTPAPGGTPSVQVQLAVTTGSGGTMTVRANVIGAAQDVRVEFQVDGSVWFPVENHDPYYLFGDNGVTPNFGTLGDGTHQIVARVYTQGASQLLASSAVMTLDGTGAPQPSPTPTQAPSTDVTLTPSATPTQAATPSPTPVAPTATPVPPTATQTRAPGAPTPTPVPPAPTSTATPLPPTPTATAVSGTRDKFKQPFASSSIWNMPIGSGAQYRSTPIFSNIQDFWTDEEPILMGGNVLLPAWENNDWPISGRVGGNLLPYQVPVPAGFTTHSATDIGNQANFSGGYLLQDGRTIVEAQGLVVRSNAVTMMIERSAHDIYGDGLPAIGGHGGSALSGVGGSVRVWEAQTDAPITHAVKCLISDRYLSASNGGYRWPAHNADSGYDTRYAGGTPDLRMGSLMALAPSLDLNALGLTSAFGKRLAWTYQNYGCYVVDELYGTSWDPITMAVEYGVNDVLQQRYGSTLESGPIANDVAKIFAQLSVVTNNGPSSIGGGGAPRQPLAPPIGN